MSSTAAPRQSSQAQAAPGEGRHATSGVSDAKNAGTGSHTDADVPAPGNSDLGKGGPTSMSGADNSHPGSKGTPAAGLGGAAGDPDKGQATISKQQPEDAETRGKVAERKTGPQPGDALRVHDGSSNQTESSRDGSGASTRGGEHANKKDLSPDEANNSGDGTFGDGTFDASAPGAAAAAQKLEAGAREEAGEEGKIHVPVK